MKISVVGLVAVFALLAGAPVSAANIVSDPGFEAAGAVICNGTAACSPLHPSWTFTNAASGTDYGVDVFGTHTGNSAFFFAGVTAGSYDALRQALTTTAGQFYTLSFWLNTSFNHSNADFQVFWNGTMIYDDPSGIDAAHQFTYTQFTFTGLQATGSSTVLRFAGFNVPSGDYLDDIVVDSGVSSVPEPASWVLTSLGALALAARKLRPR